MGRRSPDSPDVADYKMDKYHRDSRHRSPASPTSGMEKRRYERSVTPEKRRARRSRSYDSPDRRGGRGGGNRKQTENPPPSRCVGIFGMNIYTRESQIRELFSKFGQIRRINMITCSQVSLFGVIESPEYVLFSQIDHFCEEKYILGEKKSFT